MTRSFALRQVAFATRNLQAAEEQLAAAGGWKSVGRDRHAEVFDLTSHLFQRGSAFIEILVPTSEKTTLSRFLDKHADRPVVPYMLLLHDTDPDSGAYDAVPQGWRVHATQRPGYHSMQISPKAVPPLLIAVAQSGPSSTWPLTDGLIERELPTGAPTYSTIRVESSDPEHVARRWSTLLDAPLTREADAFCVEGALLSVRIRGTSDGVGLTGLGVRADLPEGRASHFVGVEWFGDC